MTDMKLMESKEPTYEVVRSQVVASASPAVTCETCDGNGEWFIHITNELNDRFVVLTGAEAIAVSEFIATHVRKRW